MSSIKENDEKYIAHTYARFPLELVSGSGSLVYDENGKQYIDLGTGIAVNTFGVSDGPWIEAVTEQLAKVQHTSNLFYSEPCSTLAKMLCERTGAGKVFFSNSGAEANECAIKAARKYAKNKKGDNCYKIITLKNSFHGRTLTTLAATGQDVFHGEFLPLTDGFVYAEANNYGSVEALVNEGDIAAIMFECVQGEGGVMPLDKDFLCAVAKLAKEKDILLIDDEVQCGNGRSGMLYAYMIYGITPDIVTTAKGLGGGLPIGATLLFDKTKDVFVYGDHGSTFGGNPVACAGGISILSRIDDELLLEVKRKSKIIFDTLSGARGIESVSGLGLMIGVKTMGDAGRVIELCREKGVLLLKAKNKVRLLPALNIPDDLLYHSLDVIKYACSEAASD